MGLKGVTGKIAWVDLSRGEVKIEEPEAELYQKYLGGYGLAAYYLFTRQKAKADPLGPDNILGLTTGPLTGTDAITGNRFTVVGKSPKTGGWGDANCGGSFGPALKQAGLDAIFFTGISAGPVYILVEDGKVTINDASDYWGLECGAVEDKFKAAHGKKARSAVIGPVGERVNALAAVINDAGRAAGRSGLGMVMGSKKLKGVVAVGGGQVEVADDEGLKAARKQILKEHYHDDNPLYGLFHSVGTPGVLEPAVMSQDAPIKNWGGVTDDFPGFKKIGGAAVLGLQEKPYGCWRCPLSCGGHMVVPSGPYAGEGHMPEYETLGSFGSMCLNDNLESICRLNNICNEAGMDTISAGATVAFAIECYENGVIDKELTGGLELTWGNHEAIVAVTEQIAAGEGFGGKILADGVDKAVERIGEAARPYAMAVGGEELPMHDPRCTPGYGITYECDATPGRHTQGGAASVEGNFVPPDLGNPTIADKYTYTGKGEAHKYHSSFAHVVNAAGLCMFASVVSPAPAVGEFLSLAMGEKITLDDVITIGERIATLRIAFNLREGVRTNEAYKLPARVLGQPPLADGPVKGVTVDNETQAREYFAAMGWNPQTGVPKKEALTRLGLDFAAEVAEG